MVDQNVDFRLGIQGDQNVVNAFGKVNNSLKQTAESGTRMNMVGMNFNRIIQDSPYFLSSFNMGIMSIGNNIGPLAESFAYAKQQGQSFMTMVKGMFTGLGGWMTVINLGVAALTAFGLAQRGSKEDTDEHTKFIDKQKRSVDLLRQSFDEWERKAKDVGDLMRKLSRGQVEQMQVEKALTIANIALLEARIKNANQPNDPSSFMTPIQIANVKSQIAVYKATLAELNDALLLVNAQFRNAGSLGGNFSSGITNKTKELSSAIEILSKAMEKFAGFNIGGLTSFGITGERNVPSKPDYSTSLTMEEIQKDFQLQYIGAQNAANAIAGVFNSMWDDIFGTAQGFWSDFFGGMLRDLTSIASKGLMTDLLNLIIPGAGLVGGLFTNIVGGGNITIVNQLGNAELNKVVLKANSDNARLRYAN